MQEWQEAELDKSLPVCEAPPEDLDGLVPVAVKVMHPGMAQAFRCASVYLILPFVIISDFLGGGMAVVWKCDLLHRFLLSFSSFIVAYRIKITWLSVTMFNSNTSAS